MKSLIISLFIVVATLTAQAQKKEYARPNPAKQYTFTITAAKLDSITYLIQQGGQSLFNTTMPANQAAKLNQCAFSTVRELSMQLRRQVVADSLAERGKRL